MALGIYNLVHARSAEKVRLKVIPKATGFRGNGPDGRELYLNNEHRFDLKHPTAPPDRLSVEIVNLSKFAVTVDDVGFKQKWTRQRLALVTPIIPDGKDWPRKLEPRESATVQFDTTKLVGLDSFGAVRCAYATSVCGTTCYGTSGALREFVRLVRKAAR